MNQEHVYRRHLGVLQTTRSRKIIVMHCNSREVHLVQSTSGSIQAALNVAHIRRELSYGDQVTYLVEGCALRW